MNETLISKRTGTRSRTLADSRTVRDRTRLLRSCGAAYQHLARYGLVSEIVVDELRRIMREERV